MKRWYKETYMFRSDKDEFSFFRFVRRVKVVLEEIKEEKKGLYYVRVADIIPLNNWTMQHLTGDHISWFIGRDFSLRRHRMKEGRSCRSPFAPNKWFDPRYPGQEEYENFYELDENGKAVSYEESIKLYER